MFKKSLTLSILLISTLFVFISCDKIEQRLKSKNLKIGDKVDSLNGVYVYYNANVGNVKGRNTTADGYNIGLKYQCVEFVKRYYYEHLNHKMPDSYGHAKDFYEKGLGDGKRSKRRNLIQYSNPSNSKPKVDDLLVFDGTTTNKYGHVAIISKVTDSKIEIIQQNPGRYGPSRENFKLKQSNGKWKIGNTKILGWLRKE
ncbi:CHAP domain-containing protein [Aequorivita xiaoshiensis]|uniref:CHAP domain-containing protein n=1 Tax=Aequorivita xiaoshiensis TaxID=2874476 RepID=A0A9X1R3Y4_9FLAO|nr:CHAP domain-containing protein [Aequorivita xiaoshiensis]MCG2431839.1 CHAP domain-containing protein [Aequorivita xiaoshiensis]